MTEMATNWISLGLGITSTILLSLGCEPFLKKTIFFNENDKLPAEYEFLNPGHATYVTGGMFFGMMESLVFFTSFGFSARNCRRLAKF